MVSNKKYSIAEAARELGMTRAGVHAAIRQKRLKAKRGTLICLIWILLARAAYGQTVIPYDIQIVNVLNIEDLNVREEYVATTFASNLLSGTLYLRKNKYKPVTVNCGGDTQPSKLNNKSQLVGSCTTVNSGPRKQYGFVRDPVGRLTLLDFPGADGTAALGISDSGKVAGQFYGPLRSDHGGALSYRFHCFTWDSRTAKYTQLDFPRENTYVNCTSINKHGKILGEYITVTLSNDYLEHGWFIYNNGTFELPFPLSMEHVGGPAFSVVAMNNLDQLVVIRANSDDAWNGIFLFDDGVLYEIGLPFMMDNLPTTWDVRGLNDDQQLAGQFTTSNCPTSDPFQCIRVTRGFIATPR